MYFHRIHLLAYKIFHFHLLSYIILQLMAVTPRPPGLWFCASDCWFSTEGAMNITHFYGQRRLEGNCEWDSYWKNTKFKLRLSQLSLNIDLSRRTMHQNMQTESSINDFSQFYIWSKHSDWSKKSVVIDFWQAVIYGRSSFQLFLTSSFFNRSSSFQLQKKNTKNGWLTSFLRSIIKTRVAVRWEF